MNLANVRHLLGYYLMVYPNVGNFHVNLGGVYYTTSSACAVLPAWCLSKCKLTRQRCVQLEHVRVSQENGEKLFAWISVTTGCCCAKCPSFQQDMLTPKIHPVGRMYLHWLWWWKDAQSITIIHVVVYTTYYLVTPPHPSILASQS